MRGIVRGVLGVLAGLLTMVVLVMATDAFGMVLIPRPEGFDMNNPENVKAHLTSLPSWAFVYMLLGYSLAGFGGGGVAALIARRAHLVHALIIGVIGAVASYFNSTNPDLPHASWFLIPSVLVFPIGAFMGGLLAALTQRLKK